MKAIPIEEKPKAVEIAAPKVSRDDRQIHQTCFQMMHYIADGREADLEETNRLLNNMERSILCIQRKKRKMVENKSRNRHK